LTTGGSGGGTTGLRGDDGAGISNSISASAPAVGEEDTYFEEKNLYTLLLCKSLLLTGCFFR
jgi:hypothetical protein